MGGVLTRAGVGWRVRLEMHHRIHEHRRAAHEHLRVEVCVIKGTTQPARDLVKGVYVRGGCRGTESVRYKQPAN